jgi:hypothetical protein
VPSRCCTALLVAASACSAVVSSGCGVVVQTVYGWNDQVEREATRTYPIAVASTPEGALITRLDPGAPIELGPAPVNDAVAVPVREVVEVPRSSWPMFLGAGVDVVLGLAMLGVRATRDEARGIDEALIDTAINYTLAGAATAAFADLIFAAIFTNAEPNVVKMTPLADERPTSYLAVKDGYQSMMTTIRIPRDGAAKLAMKVNEPVRFEGLPGLGSEEPGQARTSTITD